MRIVAKTIGITTFGDQVLGEQGEGRGREGNLFIHHPTSRSPALEAARTCMYVCVYVYVYVYVMDRWMDGWMCLM